MDVLSTRFRDQALPIGSWIPAYCLSEEFEREQKVGGGYYRFHIQMPWQSGWKPFLKFGLFIVV